MPTVSIGGVDTKKRKRMEYRPVYQTWKMIRPLPSLSSSESAKTTTMATEEKSRHRIQRLRIERRLSISSLADMARCDVETLAAYERGDEVLTEDMLRRLDRILG